PLVEVTWDAADALPVPLCLSSTGERDEAIADVSVARGNVVLVDHGARVTGEDLGQAGGLSPFRPQLERGPLTQQGRVRDHAHHDRLVLFDPLAPASAATQWDIPDVRPAITLQSVSGEWEPQHDLLASDRFATEFVVETQEDGRAYLRFGDNQLGRKPVDGESFTATYRVGNGKQGNVGADSITRLVGGDEWVRRVWNPLPAVGGQDPESLEQVRQFAPQAFRVQERAVTPADYVEVTQRRSDVQRAAASLRWTGSWYTAFVTVDRAGGLPADAPYEQDLRAYLDAYRMAGVDLEINGPTYVPLDLALSVCVKDGYFRADVKQALLRTFSAQAGSGVSSGPNARGFFHPDNFTFGQALYLSQVYRAALAVDGVASVSAVRFQRWGQVPNGELAAGELAVGPFEVVRLDNDPNFPENGKIEFVVEGGL
ncbi:MAG: putative baseplate assembly protein, partial [Nitrososphaerales archaeon]